MGEGLTKRLSLIVSMTSDKAVAGMQKLKTELSTLKNHGASIFDSLKAKVHAFGEKLFSLRGIAAAVGLAYSAQTFIRSFAEQEQAITSLNAALAKNGQYSRAASQELVKYAEALQAVTMHSDDAIVAGMAMMANVGQLAASQLPAASKAAIGFADALGVDLQTAFMLVGRSAAGQNQLWTRYGVVLDMTKSKEEIFQEVVKKGNEFFKQSTALAETQSGKLKQLANIWDDVKEILGSVVLTGFSPLMDILKKVMNLFQALPDAVKMPIAAMGLLSIALKTLGVSFTTMWTAAGGWPAIIVTGIIAVYTAIKTNLFGIVKQTGEEFQKLDTQAKNVAASLQTQSLTVGPLVQTYEALNAKTNLSESEHAKLRAALNGISDIMPEIVSGVNAEGEAIRINLPLYKQMLDLRRQEHDMLMRESRAELVKDIETYEKKSRELPPYLENLYKLQQTVAVGSQRWKVWAAQIAIVTDQLIVNKQQLADAKARMAELNAMTMIGPPVPQAVQNTVEQIQTVTNAAVQAQDTLAAKAEEMRKQIEALTNRSLGGTRQVVGAGMVPETTTLAMPQAEMPDLGMWSEAQDYIDAELESLTALSAMIQQLGLNWSDVSNTQAVAMNAMIGAGTSYYDSITQMSLAYFSGENKRIKSTKILTDQMWWAFEAGGLEAIATVLKAEGKRYAIQAVAAAIVGDFGDAAKYAAIAAAAGAGAAVMTGYAASVRERAVNQMNAQGGTRLDTTGMVETDINGRPTGGTYGGVSVTSQPQAITIAPSLAITGETILIGDLGVDELTATLGRVIVDTVKSAIELGEINVGAN